MNCPKCGTQNPDDVKICQACNQLLFASPDIPQKNVKTCNLAKWSLALAVIGLYAPFMYLIIFSFPSYPFRFEIQQWQFIFILPLLLSLNPPFTLFLGVAALINGFIGLSKIKKSNGNLKGKGLAITGISISFLLIAWFLVTSYFHLEGDLNRAGRADCRKSLSSLGVAMRAYAKDHNDTYPQANNWCDVLIKNYNVNPKQFCCPAGDAKEGQSSYAFNINAVGKKAPEIPLDMVLIFETAEGGWDMVGGAEILSTKNHQLNGCNVLFADQHVEYVKTKDLSKLRWKAD